MEKSFFNFAKVRPSAKIPTKETENAGYDIYADFTGIYMHFNPMETKLVPTGIASALSENFYLQVEERGSTGSKGIKYGAGVIDSSYRGEIFIPITNCSDKELYISKVSKEVLVNDYNADVTAVVYPYEKAVAQLIVHRVHNELTPVEITYEELSKIPSKRGTGNLGSSGK